MLAKNNQILKKILVFLCGTFVITTSLLELYAEYPKITALRLVYADDDLYSIEIEQDSRSDFPKQLFLFPDTKRIVLDYCLFEKIPDDFIKYEKLEELKIRNCYKLDYEDLFTKLNKNLKDVILYSDSLRSLPKSLSQHINLKSMDCSNNLIEFVPKEILTLENLTYLDLSENFVKTFVIDSQNSSKIKRLDLSKNRLFKLPEGLDNLTKLEDLDLDYNWQLDLYEICEVSSKLPLLKSISLDKEIVLDKFEEDDFDKMKVPKKKLPSNINYLKGIMFSFPREMFNSEDILKMGEIGIKFGFGVLKQINNYKKGITFPDKCSFNNKELIFNFLEDNKLEINSSDCSSTNQLEISIYNKDFLFKDKLQFNELVNEIEINKIVPEFNTDHRLYLLINYFGITDIIEINDYVRLK